MLFQTGMMVDILFHINGFVALKYNCCKRFAVIFGQISKKFARRLKAWNN